MKYIIRFPISNFFDQIALDLSKMDQNGSNLIFFDFWWNNHWNILSDFQLFCCWSDLIRPVQNGWKWIKHDQSESDLSKLDQNGSTWSNLMSDEIIVEICHQIFNFIHFLITLNQICPKWTKMDQTWSNNRWNSSSDFQLYLSSF